MQTILEATQVSTHSFYRDHKEDVHKYIDAEKEDALQTLKALAVSKVSAYREDREVKLSTFIYRCLTNELSSAKRDAMRLKRKGELEADDTLEGTVDHSYMLPEAEIDMEIQAQRLLTGEQYHLLTAVLSGVNLMDKAKELSQISGKSVKTEYRRLKKCFSVITAKFT